MALPWGLGNGSCLSHRRTFELRDHHRHENRKSAHNDDERDDDREYGCERAGHANARELVHDAVEQNVSLIALGHYASETTGPRAVMKLLGEKFGIETVFADIPTGL